MDPNHQYSLPPYPQPAPPHHLPLPHHLPHPQHYSHPQPQPQSQPPITYPPPGTEPYPNYKPYNPQFPYPNSDKQQINTLFISGLPDDVKPREIHNLFRRRSAFDFCQIKYTGLGNQVVAFASFLDHQAAMEVLHTLNGAIFDPSTGATLKIELARSNSRPKRNRSGAYHVINKRAKVSNDAHETSSNDGDEDSDEPLHTNNPNKGGFATAESANDHNARAKDNEQGGDRAPCSTLFIANLGPNCTNEELTETLSIYPGFRIVKMRANRGMPVAFADFKEFEQATEAMQGLQGTELPSSDRGGMHIEYARSKMKKF